MDEYHRTRRRASRSGLRNQDVASDVDGPICHVLAWCYDRAATMPVPRYQLFIEPILRFLARHEGSVAARDADAAAKKAAEEAAKKAAEQPKQ